MSEARLYYNHVVDSLPNKNDRDAIRTYVDELEQRIIDIESDGVALQSNVELYYTRSLKFIDENYILKEQKAKLMEFLEETISMTDSFQTERDWREWREAAIKLLEETDGI